MASREKITAEWQNDRRMSKHVPRLRKRSKNRNTEIDMTCVISAVKIPTQLRFSLQYTHQEP